MVEWLFDDAIDGQEKPGEFRRLYRRKHGELADLPIPYEQAEAIARLDTAQAVSNHKSPHTTKPYDRAGDEIILDEVEWVRI